VHSGHCVSIEQAFRWWVHEQFILIRGRMLVSLGGLYIDVERPAEGREYALVVEEEGGEEVVAVHVQTEIIPVMFSHCGETFSFCPLGGCKV